MDRDELLRVLRAFESCRLEYVLIGAAAMGVHGLIRATEDIDIFIKATAENVEKLREAFRQAYPGDENIEQIRSEDLLGEYPSVRYYPPTGDLFFDVLTKLGEAASYDTVDSQVAMVEDIRVIVATPRALYDLKKATVRAKDRGRVRKFRSIEEMDAWQEPPRQESATDAFDRFLRHCRRYWQLHPRQYPRGVRRFRTLEDPERLRSHTS